MKHPSPIVQCLDHGLVRLVSSMGTDLDVVRSARVSYDAEPRLDGSDEKLIRYLLVNKHTSPFESVVFTFEIKCPIFVARQWHRHRTWSFNEVSARYTELPEEYYLPEVDKITTQHASNKQMRTDDVNPSARSIRAIMDEQMANAFYAYKLLLQLGTPRELARSVLPVGTYTRFFGTVDLHNLLHFLRLRLHAHAQYEIRVYAAAILSLIEPIVPTTIKYFKETLNESN